MKLKRILTGFALLLFLIPNYLLGQTQDSQLNVNSNPNGALVELSGLSKVSGVTPVSFSQGLVGKYKVTVEKKGYERYNSYVLLDPTKVVNLDVTLSKKTRFKAFARSMFIPGWGQRYSDRSTKGYAYTILTVLAGIGYFIADDEFDYRNDLYNDKVREYDSLNASGAVGDLHRVYTEMVEKQEDAYDAENVRRGFIGAVVSIYALNLLDALFLFPKDEGVVEYKGLSLKPEANFEEVGLKLSLAF